MFISNSRRVVWGSYVCVIDHEHPCNLIEIFWTGKMYFSRNYLEAKGKIVVSYASILFLSFFLSLSPSLASYRRREWEYVCAHTLMVVSVWRVVLDAMQPFIEQPEFVLEPKSTFIFENHPIRLQCKAIRSRQIFFNCDNKWLPEQEHSKSTETNVRRRFCFSRCVSLDWIHLFHRRKVSWSFSQVFN